MIVDRVWVGIAIAGMIGGSIPGQAVAAPPDIPPVTAPADGVGPETAAPSPDDEGRPSPDADTTTPGEAPGDPAPPPDPKVDALVQQATQHFVEGRALYLEGQYIEAAAEFQRSYAAIPTGSALYNIALAYEKAGRPVKALTHARKYLALPDCEPGRGDELCVAPGKRDEVAKTERRLTGLLGALWLDIAEGVNLREVRVAGKTVPLDAFPLMVLPGEVEVELFGLSADQHRIHNVRVTAGQTWAIEVRPFSEIDPKVEDGNGLPTGGGGTRFDPAKAKRRERALKASFWSGIGVTAAMGIATGAVGGVAIRAKQDDDDRSCPQPPDGCTDPNKGERVDRFENLRTATNVLIGVTAGIAAVTAVIGIFAFTGKRSNRRASTRVRMTAGGINIRF